MSFTFQTDINVWKGKAVKKKLREEMNMEGQGGHSIFGSNSSFFSLNNDHFPAFFI